MFFLGLMFEGHQDHEISINLWQTISQYHQTHVYFLCTCIQAVQHHTFPTVKVFRDPSLEVWKHFQTVYAILT